MQYSPKLKTAAEEIKDVLRKHDIAAIVALHTPGHGEYIFHLQPSYSAVITHADGVLGIKTNPEDSREMKHQKIADTADMLNGLAQTTGHLSKGTIHLLEELSKHVDILRFGSDHSSHTEQNN